MKKRKEPVKLTSDQEDTCGFTLVELLVSFSLVIFLILGTIQLTLYSLLIKRKADCNLKSATLVSSLLEYLKSLPYESEELKEGFRTEGLSGESLLETYRREWRIQDISSNIKRIEAESFSESHPQKKTRLALFLSRELGF
ncbi:MAG: hypothetical protein ISS41_06600 [Candidatus Aminicenantes bacterium]|nr:hypothetical protein [Candidatus Aminicenantes bacterium]MBL7083281.1 hypothetical protein [Candidatus Aminicenantes bacterium]